MRCLVTYRSEYLTLRLQIFDHGHICRCMGYHQSVNPLLHRSEADMVEPKSPITSIKLPSDVLHISFHPSGAHFAVVCPRPSRDEVHFFHRTSVDGAEQWTKREDILIGGAGEDLGAEEVSPFIAQTILLITG
jgi:hypothetical protein